MLSRRSTPFEEGPRSVSRTTADPLRQRWYGCGLAPNYLTLPRHWWQSPAAQMCSANCAAGGRPAVLQCKQQPHPPPTLHPPIHQPTQLPRPLHHPLIMRRKHKCRPLLPVELLHHVEQRLGHRLVQVGRGFVGQHQRGFRQHRARHRHPLLLPARQLRRLPVLQLRDLLDASCRNRTPVSTARRTGPPFTGEDVDRGPSSSMKLTRSAMLLSSKVNQSDV